MSGLHPKAIVEAIRKTYWAMTECPESAEGMAEAVTGQLEIAELAESMGISLDDVYELALRMAQDYMPDPIDD
jgi:hypothetical protein